MTKFTATSNIVGFSKIVGSHISSYGLRTNDLEYKMETNSLPGVLEVRRSKLVKAKMTATVLGPNAGELVTHTHMKYSKCVFKKNTFIVTRLAIPSTELT